MIQAKVVAHSINELGDELLSVEVVMPRIILAELNTHRMLAKNSASSRAIPTKKMLEMLHENPFIPIAWQEEHKGMQGTSYVTDSNKIEQIKTRWLMARNSAIQHAEYLIENKITKQVANRLLEPFMYHKVLITGNVSSLAWGNFFELRCPQYWFNDAIETKKSRKDMLIAIKEHYKLLYLPEDTELPDINDDLWWFSINKGQAEIHMMALAEAIWDARNESTPKQLQAGDWHIVYEDKIKFNGNEVDDRIGRKGEIFKNGEYNNLYTIESKVKVSTAMAARTSYTTVGDEKEVTYEDLLRIYETRLLPQPNQPWHASPFDHNHRAMTNIEYECFIRGHAADFSLDGDLLFDDTTKGWCRQSKGFIPYRHIIETGM